MKKKKQEKRTKKPIVTTKVRYDGTKEVEFQKNPKDTLIGKILIYLLVAGIVLIPIVVLIYTMITIAK